MVKKQLPDPSESGLSLTGLCLDSEKGRPHSRSRPRSSRAPAGKAMLLFLCPSLDSLSMTLQGLLTKSKVPRTSLISDRPCLSQEEQAVIDEYCVRPDVYVSRTPVAAQAPPQLLAHRHPETHQGTLPGLQMENLRLT